ncbi:MAG: amino acid ABC transporter permease [Rhizobiales bacterium 65-9]|nr:amino acid ABC transporter permease [Hyphomicrobiales bacterium]OJY33940.1 MAG: amino acid ABC transporter permease [Rhizobiales bacterium 65-9]
MSLTHTANRRPAKARRRLGALDLALLAALAAVCVYTALRIENGLNYRWDWRVVTTFLIKTDPATGRIAPNLLLEGLFTTLRLAFWGLAFAALIGVVMGVARTSKRLLPRLISGAYVMLVRNIPPLVFVFIVVFFIGSQILPVLGISQAVSEASPTSRWWLSLLFGQPALIENFVAGVFCLALFSGAYVAEIVRAGIQSVSKNQIEAGDSLGLSRIDLMRFIIIPQALRNVLPPLANQFIQLIKDSSLVSLVSIQELTFMAQDIQVLTNKVFEVLLFTGAVYFVICYGLSLIFSALERRAASARR